MVGNGQMFSSSPTSTDPLLFNAGTLRMSTEGLKDAEGHARKRRGQPRKGKHCSSSVKYDPLPLHVQGCLIFSVFLTRLQLSIKPLFSSR